jgi:plasmid maintenance system antidote protein VapI
MNQRLKIVIAELRKRKKVYSQAEFAEIVGISRTQFSEIVTGKRKLSDKAIHKIIAAIPDINEDWLRTGEGEMLKSYLANADNHSISIAGEEVKENKINVNTDETIAMLVAEVAAQRKLTEKVLEQNSDLIAIIAGKR